MDRVRVRVRVSVRVRVRVRVRQEKPTLEEDHQVGGQVGR